MNLKGLQLSDITYINGDECPGDPYFWLTFTSALVLQSLVILSDL